MSIRFLALLLSARMEPVEVHIVEPEWDFDVLMKEVEFGVELGFFLLFPVTVAPTRGYRDARLCADPPFY